MTLRLLRLAAAVLCMTAGTAYSAVTTLHFTGATVTVDTSQTFGPFKENSEFVFSDLVFQSLVFDKTPILEADSGQSLSQISAISVTIAALPGYIIQGLSFRDEGLWTTFKQGSVDIAATSSLTDTHTGNPSNLGASASVHDSSEVIGTFLSTGGWFFSGNAIDPAPLPNSVTLTLSRTLFASGGQNGAALIGNQTGGPHNGGLNIDYTLQFVGGVVVPEPQTGGLFLVGLGSVGFFVARRRVAAHRAF